MIFLSFSLIKYSAIPIFFIFEILFLKYIFRHFSPKKQIFKCLKPVFPYFFHSKNTTKVLMKYRIFRHKRRRSWIARMIFDYKRNPKLNPSTPFWTQEKKTWIQSLKFIWINFWGEVISLFWTEQASREKRAWSLRVLRCEKGGDPISQREAELRPNTFESY